MNSWTFLSFRLETNGRTIWLHSFDNSMLCAQEWDIKKIHSKFFNDQRELWDLGQIKKSHQIHLYKIC